MGQFLFAVLFVFSLSAQAKTLVIVDIDDTLRVTNRVYGSYSEQLDNVLNFDLSFSGMQELMATFDRQGAQINYLTAAVAPLDELGRTFLEYNDYPQTDNYIYKSWFDDTEEYKVAECRRLIKKHKPDSIILIGDNGEKDSAAYGRIQGQFPGVQVYIHYLYKYGTSIVIPYNQVAYITAAEIATFLEERFTLSAVESQKVIAKVYSDATSSDELNKYLVLPYWSDIYGEDIVALYSRPFSVTTETKASLQELGNVLLTLKTETLRVF